MDIPDRHHVALRVLLCTFATIGLACATTGRTCHDDTPSEVRASQAAYFKKIEKYPADEDAWYELGMSHYKLLEFPEAEKAFTSLLSLNADHGGAYVSRGICRLMQQDTAGGCSDFQMAIALNYDPPVLDGSAVSHFVSNNCK